MKVNVELMDTEARVSNMITDEKEIEKKVSGYAIYAPQYKERY